MLGREHGPEPEADGRAAGFVGPQARKPVHRLPEPRPRHAPEATFALDDPLAALDPPAGELGLRERTDDGLRRRAHVRHTAFRRSRSFSTARVSHQVTTA